MFEVEPAGEAAHVAVRLSCCDPEAVVDDADSDSTTQRYAFAAGASSSAPAAVWE